MINAYPSLLSHDSFVKTTLQDDSRDLGQMGLTMIDLQKARSENNLELFVLKNRSVLKAIENKGD